MKRFDFSLFEKLIPVKHLSNTDKEILIDYTDLVSYETGQTIFKQDGYDNNICYLCNGIIELSSTSGVRFEITSDGDDANYPLAYVYPRQYTAKVVVDSSVLVIRRDKLDELISSNRSIADSCCYGFFELKAELVNLRCKLDHNLKSDNPSEEIFSMDSKKTEREIQKKCQRIRETMKKALSIYEDTKIIKEKLLEDRIAAKKLIEKLKKRHEEAVHTIDLEDRIKISVELRKIEELYAAKEKQIKQLQKLKEIAQKRLQANQLSSRPAIDKKINDKILNARLKILRDRRFRDYLNNLEKIKTESFISGIANNTDTKPKIDIEKINQNLRQELENNQALEGDEQSTSLHDQNTELDPVKRDIDDWIDELETYENSDERLRELKEKREIMRKIYERAKKNKAISRIRDRILITEISSSLKQNDRDED